MVSENRYLLEDALKGQPFSAMHDLNSVIGVRHVGMNKGFKPHRDLIKARVRTIVNVHVLKSLVLHKNHVH